MMPDDLHLDGLRELINVGVGQAAGSLNRVLQTHVALRVPEVQFVTREEMPAILNEFASGLVAGVLMAFEGPLAGSVVLLFPADGASKIVSTITGDTLSVPDLDSIQAGTLCEVGNVVLNAVMGTIANVLKVRMKYSVPVYMEGPIGKLFDSKRPSSGDVYIVARVRFLLEELLVGGDIVMCLDIGSFDHLLLVLDEFQEQIHARTRGS